MTKMSRKARIITIILAVVLLVGGLAGAVSAGSQEEIIEEINRDVIVDTITPEIGNIVVMGEYIGVMEPSRQVSVHPKAAAEVLAVHYHVGDYVEAGEILFELDSTALETSIAQTQAAVSSAQAKANQNLNTAQTSLATFDFNVEEGHDNTLKAAQNAIDGAQAAMDGATQGKNNALVAVETAENRLNAAHASLNTARRQERNFRDDGTLPISMASMVQMQGMFDEQIEDQLRDTVRQAQLAVDAAQLGVEQAKIALQSAENGIEQARKNLDKATDGYKSAEAVVEAQRKNIVSQVDMARLNTNFSDQQIAINKLQNDLENFVVAAPISGVIERRNVEPLNMASPQAPAFVISDKNSMIVSFKIPRNSHAHMKIGDKVELEDKGSVYTGTITEISTMVDQSGLFTVKANIQNPPADLYTGASVKVFAESQKAENAVIIPLSAIRYDNGIPFVFVVEDGVAKKVQVEVGIFDHQSIHIVSGVGISDQVINTWSSRLNDGVQVMLAYEVENIVIADDDTTETLPDDEAYADQEQSDIDLDEDNLEESEDMLDEADENNDQQGEEEPHQDGEGDN